MQDKKIKTITIIPNDDILNVPVYYNESYSLDHYQLASGFSTKYNLPYIGENSDVDISKDGHILLKTWSDNSCALGYIRVPLTKRQYDNFFLLKNYLRNFNYYAFNIEGEETKHIYKQHSEDVETLDSLFEELKKHIKIKKR